MATVDNGIIVQSDSNWLRVKPRCPYCGHVESDWGLESIGVPKMAHSTKFTSHMCSQCRKSFRITAYPG